MYKKIVLTICILLVQNSVNAEYSDDKIYEINIHSQPLEVAIEKLKNITSLEVIFFSETIKDVKSSDVSGQFTAKQALKNMLLDTDLQLVSLSQSGSFAIKKYKQDNLEDDNNVSYRTNQTKVKEKTEPSNKHLTTDDSSAEILETVVITGSNIKGINIISPIPTISIERDEIETAGTTDLGEIIEELPGVYLGISPAGSLLDTQNSGLSTISLRALGSNRTLTLINGKRVVSNSGNAQRVDTATIPPGFINFIDITTGGASAAYGSDAIAGVANIVLRNDFVGMDFNVRYEDSYEGGRETSSADFTWGSNFSEDRGNIMIGANWEKKNALFASDRDYALNTLRINLETGELSPFLSSYTDGGRFENGDAWNTGGVWQNDQEGSQYCLDDGRIPACDDFQTALDGWDFRPYSMLFPKRDSVSAMLTSNYAFDTVTSTFMLHYTETDTKSQRAPAVANDAHTFGPFDDRTRIGDISPDNPFVHPAVLETLSGTVDWRRRMVEVGLRDLSSNRATTRVSFGLEGYFNSNWYWNSYIGYGQFKQHQEKHNELNRQNIQYALNVEEDPNNLGNYRCISESARNEGCVPLNIFGVGSITPDAADYIRHTIVMDQKLTQTSANFTVNGTLMNLPNGPIQSAFGIDYRRETQVINGDPISHAGLTTSSSLLDINASYNVKEVFGELNIPLIADKSWVQSLDMTTALRLANYNTVGNVSSWNMGLSYAINDNIRFRAQLSQAQRAPDITELFSAQRSDFDSVNDPCDGVTSETSGIIAENCRSIVGIADIIATEGVFEQDGASIFGPSIGNVNLKEETADTITYGFVYTPQALENFSFIADYYQIEVKDAIGSVSSQLAADLCYSDAQTFTSNRFCESITRGSDGQISRIINQDENLNSLTSEGIDVTMAYKFMLSTFPGKFKASLNYAHILTNEKRFDGPTGEVVDDFLGEVGLPEDEFRFRLKWFDSKYTIQYKLKYTGSVVDNNNPDPADIFGFIKFDAVLVHDLHFSYKFDNQHPIRFYAGIRNLTNEHGPYLPSGYNSGSILNTSSAYDRVGRRYYAGIDWTW